MKHKLEYSEGNVTYVICVWEEVIFLAIADCEFLYYLIGFS